MIFVGIGVVIVVSMIGAGEMGFSVATCCMGGDEIRDSEMNIGVTAHTGMTCWIGGEGTVHVMIGIRMGAENFATLGALFVVTSFVSSGVQKKVYSEDGVRCRYVVAVETFEGKASSFMFSVSGNQKKDRPETGFVHGDTSDEMSFIGDENQSDFTC